MKDKLLQCDLATDRGGTELSRLLGEVLQAEKNQHILGYGNLEANCRKCNKLLKVSGPSGLGRNLRWEWIDGVDRICTIADPIALTWPEAMKHFEAMLEKHGKAEMIKAMKEVYLKATGDTNGADYVLDWWPFHARQWHYLQASAICKINKTR